MRSRTAAALLAALAWVALSLQLSLTLRTSLAGGDGIAQGVWLFLAYFTVLTNLLVALVATRAAAWADGGIDLPGRGCAVASIVVVGIGYHLLLRDAWNPQGLQWLADLLLHYATPLAALLWWLALPPRGRIVANAPLRWLAWPVLYVAYAMVRGAVSGFYPYPFIDAPALGYARVMLNVAGLALAFLAIGYGLRESSNRRSHAAT